MGGRRISMRDELRRELQARVDNGQRLSHIAAEAGILQPTLHRFFRGQKDMTLDVADPLVAYFGWTFKKPRRRK